MSTTWFNNPFQQPVSTTISTTSPQASDTTLFAGIGWKSILRGRKWIPEGKGNGFLNTKTYFKIIENHQNH